jgi:hypothetical protein
MLIAIVSTDATLSARITDRIIGASFKVVAAKRPTQDNRSGWLRFDSTCAEAKRKPAPDDSEAPARKLVYRPLGLSLSVLFSCQEPRLVQADGPSGLTRMPLSSQQIQIRQGERRQRADASLTIPVPEKQIGYKRNWAGR